MQFTITIEDDRLIAVARNAIMRELDPSYYDRLACHQKIADQAREQLRKIDLTPYVKQAIAEALAALPAAVRAEVDRRIARKVGDAVRDALPLEGK